MTSRVDPNADLTPGVREDEITMMREPMRWPNMVLPLKRKNPGTLFNQYGTMVAVEGFQTYVFLGLMFQGEQIMDQIVHIHEKGEPDPDGIEFTKYDSYEEIFDDGWRVD